MNLLRAASRIGPVACLAAAALIEQSRLPAPAGAQGLGPGEASELRSRGEVVFVQRCGVCHSTGELGERGPGLAGIVGRKAGTGRAFGYTRALRESGLTWDRPTLDRFLSAPGKLVAGTTMPIPLEDADVRRDVIDYLATLHPTALSTSTAVTPSSGDYHGDSPGVRRLVKVGDLPPPYATPSARNGPNTVDPPRGAHPAVPPGFSAELFARDLQNPRLVRVAPNGDVFVAETASNQIRLLRAVDGATAPDRTEVFASGLDRPFGMAFFPPGPDPQWLYVANLNSVVRFPYVGGDLHARGAPHTVVSRLAPTSGGHSTRDVAFSSDGARMFVSVGSASNVAEPSTTRSQGEIAAWEASHGLGAAWDEEEDRADVLAWDAEGGGRQTFATGIRNCVGLAVHPGTGDLWCSTNERDGLGDDLVPDYVTRVRAGAFYGWPWFYLGDHEDPRHAGARPDLVGKVTLPDVLLQAHSAPLQVTFYGGAMFPPAYRGDAFVCLHGSWNRASRTGPKVIRVRMNGGEPTGEYEDFVTGFVVDDDSVWARPVGVAVAHDGALLFTDDANGTLWRVAYRASRP